MKKVSLVATACLLLSVSADAQGWVDVSDPNNTPGGSNDSPMCYDANIQKIVLLQGNITWTFDASGWTQIPTTNTPVINPNMPMTCGANTTPASSYLGYSAMAYHPGRSGTVLLRRVRGIFSNGYGSNCYAMNQFFFDGQDWTDEGIAFYLGYGSSYANAKPLMAYDQSSGALYTYWNSAGSGFLSSDALGSWHPVSGSLVSPPAIGSPPDHLFSDQTSQRIKFLQRDGSGSAFYEYDSGTGQWAQCFPSSYPGPITSSSPYNMLGLSQIANGPTASIGLYASGPYTLSTVRFTGCSIEELFLPVNPSYRLGSSIAYDAHRSVYVMHGGSGFADTWELTLGPGASYSTTGTGCVGTGGTPTLQSANGSLPVAGSQFNVQVSGMPWNTFAFMFLGTQNTSYAGVPLPFDLAPVGAPGCVLRSPGTYLYGFPNVLGTGLWTYNVPYLPGQVFYNQAIIFDPAANSLGLTVSNVGEAVIGS